VPPRTRQAPQGVSREMYLSMEVMSDRRAVWSSRTSLRSDLGAASVREPLRRDSQAGAPTRFDGHDTGSVDGDHGGPTSHRGRARSNRQKASIHQSHLSGVKPLGARSFVRRGGNSFQDGRHGRDRNDPVRARRDLTENERGTGARD